MHSYTTQPIVTEKLYDSSGTAHTIVNPNRLEVFKSTLESHLSTLTTEVQTLKQHANWMEPRIHEYLKFMQWMERVHPDVITAYTRATEVEQTLDRANGDDHPHAEVSA